MDLSALSSSNEPATSAEASLAPDSAPRLQTIAVFVNDTHHALKLLQTPLNDAGPTRWVLVACPPALTRHAGRWLTKSARRRWCEQWAADTLAAIGWAIEARSGDVVEKIVPQGALLAVADRLRARAGSVRVIDARQARWGALAEPITPDQPVSARSRWAAQMAVTTGLSAVLALAD
ncbi:hypothetical protein BH11PSE8_BH11PSE8_48170 [soil metagenome]